MFRRKRRRVVVEPADDKNLAALTPMQQVRIRALHTELVDRIGGWAVFVLEDGTDPLQVYFCKLNSRKIIGGLKLHTNGLITDRQGVGNDYLT